MPNCQLGNFPNLLQLVPRRADGLVQLVRLNSW